VGGDASQKDVHICIIFCNEFNLGRHFNINVFMDVIALRKIIHKCTGKVLNSIDG
jgi:hypothetical protein